MGDFRKGWWLLADEPTYSKSFKCIMGIEWHRLAYGLPHFRPIGPAHHMKKVFSNVKFLIVSSVLFVLGSAAASIWSQHWHWFGRSGAILTIAGVMLTFRPFIRMGLTEWLRSQSSIDGGNFNPTAAEIESDRQVKIDGSASMCGIYMAIVGTLIWAYGDLVGG